jgi:hypothetical protein
LFNSSVFFFFFLDYLFISEKYDNMGAAASFNNKEVEPRMRRSREDEDEFSYPRRQHSNLGRSNDRAGGMMSSTRSGRSGRTMNSSTTTRSVRAMALLNHSRHENSYINTDEISVHLKNQSLHKRTQDIVVNTAPSIDSKIDESPNEGVESSEKKVEPTMIKPQPLQLTGGIGAGITADEYSDTGETSVRSLRTFKANFNLKLNLENEPDWGHVSFLSFFSSLYPLYPRCL